MPPSHLIYLVIGHGLRGDFFRSGGIVVADQRAILADAGVDVSRLTAILDFGCGCGRLIRHWRAATRAELFGSDLNPLLID